MFKDFVFDLLDIFIYSVKETVYALNLCKIKIYYYILVLSRSVKNLCFFLIFSFIKNIFINVIVYTLGLSPIIPDLYGWLV